MKIWAFEVHLLCPTSPIDLSYCAPARSGRTVLPPQFHCLNGLFYSSATITDPNARCFCFLLQNSKGESPLLSLALKVPGTREPCRTSVSKKKSSLLLAVLRQEVLNLGLIIKNKKKTFCTAGPWNWVRTVRTMKKCPSYMIRLKQCCGQTFQNSEEKYFLSKKKAMQIR